MADFTHDSPTALNQPSPKKANVLVVEDERELADLFTVWLSDEHTVRTAYTGTEAMELLDPAVDVVLLDRRLPDHSGDEILGRIREQDIDCQVAMITAVDPDFDLLKLDIDEYVTKPVSKSDLRSLVETLSTRNALEQDLQTFQALASKKKALEETKTEDELRANRQYEVLTSTLSALREDFETQLDSQSRDVMSPWQRYPRTEIIAGIGALWAVGVLLIVAHFGVPNAPERLLSYDSPRSNPLVAYLSLFAHLSHTHLYGNVGSYLAVSTITYILCLRLIALRWFYLTAILLFTILPLGSVAITYSIFDVIAPTQEPLFVGFSHVVSGFVGFSFLVFLTLLRTVYDSRSVLFAGGYVVFFATAAVFWLHGIRLFILTAAGSLLLFGVFAGEEVRKYTNERNEKSKIALVNGVSILVISGLYAGAGIGLIPVIELDAFPGTLGHLIGFAGGFSLALVTALFLNIFPIRARMKKNGYPLPDRLL